MPAGTIGFRVSGDVTARSYRTVLTPDLVRAAESHEGVRAVFVIEDLSSSNPPPCGRTANSGGMPGCVTITPGNALRS